VPDNFKVQPFSLGYSLQSTDFLGFGDGVADMTFSFSEVSGAEFYLTSSVMHSAPTRDVLGVSSERQVSLARSFNAEDHKRAVPHNPYRRFRMRTPGISIGP
jgi:5-keto 4-deoxyuronate isomerase